MEILLSNDDGIESPGLAALAEVLAALGRVTVVAPDRERSAVAHSLTLHRPLRLREIRPGWHASDGTPTDCVHLGVHAVLERTPDLLIAGINQGPNMGDDLTYSGTVSVAMEGAFLGIPAIAVSLAARNDFHFGPAAQVTRKIAEEVLLKGLPERIFLNVNVPNVDAAEKLGGIRVTTQGRRVFGSGITRKTDPRGASYYWIGGSELGYVDGDSSTDVAAVAQGHVSVTPLSTDLTSHCMVDRLRHWRL